MATNGKSNGAMVTFDASKFEASVANMSRSVAGRADFLRMDKSGDWYYGKDDTPVGDDLIYIDPMGSVHGWQCWADTDLDGVNAELLGDKVAAAFDPLPERPDAVPKNGREWTEMRGLSAVLGDHKLTYTTTSLGGKEAVAALGSALREQYKADKTKLVAVVKLTCDWYKHKKYGKTFVPVLDIVDWVSAPPVASAAPAAPAKKAAAKKLPPPPAKKTSLKRPAAR